MAFRQIERPEKEYIAVHYSIKLFGEPSEFGINNGKISKLQLKQDGEIVANYDRGWDIYPDHKGSRTGSLHLVKPAQLKEVSIMTTIKYAASGEQRKKLVNALI